MKVEMHVVILFILPTIFYTIVWILKFVNQWLNYLNLINQLPGPNGLPIFGNALQFAVSRDKYIDVFCNICKNFNDKPLIRLRLLHKVFVFILKTDAAEEFLVKTRDMPKAGIYDLIKPWLGTGLLTSSGDKWQKHRKLLTPSFHFQILEDFMHSFNERSEILVSKLKLKSDDDPFNVHPYITLCTLDIICDTAMGKSINAQVNGDSEYVKAVQQMGEIFSLRSASPWLHPDWIFSLTSLGRRQKCCLEILHSFTRKVILERKLSFLNGNYQLKAADDSVDEIFGRKKRRLAFLDTLLQLSYSSDCLTDEEVREEVDTFMFEGHDTTSSCINWTLCLLGWHLDIQQEIYEELLDVFGNEDRFVTTEDLVKLKYLEAVIKESLRIFPPIPLYGKRLTKDTIIGGYIIPSNTDVLVPLKMLHNDEEYFTNPSQFFPSRFLHPMAVTSNGDDPPIGRRNHSGYLPFSAGPRNCIGQKFALMEIKVILSHILRRYQVVTRDNVDDVKLVAEPVLRPLHGLNMSIYAR